MPKPSELIRTLLLQAPPVVGAVLTADWGTSISKMPTTPIRVVGIFDTGGIGAPNPALLLDFPTVQIQVRGNPADNAIVYSKAKEIKDRCLGAPSQDISGDRLVSVGMISDITFMGRDESNDQPSYSINFRLIVEPATNALTQRIPI